MFVVAAVSSTKTSCNGSRSSQPSETSLATKEVVAGDAVVELGAPGVFEVAVWSSKIADRAAVQPSCPLALPTAANFVKRQVRLEPVKSAEVWHGLDALRTRVTAHRQRRAASAFVQRRTHRIALANFTPNRRAAARQLMPFSPTAATTRLRKSTDKGPIRAASESAHFKNQILPALESPPI